MTIKAFAYVRVSTEKQVDADTQLNQKKALAEYAAVNDIGVTHWFEDLGVSGSVAERDAFQEMFSRIEEVDAVLVWDTSRLARDLETGAKYMFLLRDKGKLLIEVKTGKKMDFSNKTDQLLHLIASWSDDVQRDTIKINQKKGIERSKLKNGRWGPLPKPINWREFEDLRKAGVGKVKVARYFKMHRNTLVKREHTKYGPEGYQVPEEYLKKA